MKTFQSILPVFGLVAAARAWGAGWNDTVTVVTISEYTTVCPSATTFSEGGHTYTATASETIVVTDCPCTRTISKPAVGTPVPHTYVVPSGNATWVPPVWVPTVVTVATLTTYCPSATTFSQGSSAYTVTVPTTLVITDCPCTKTTSVPAPASEYVTSTFSTLTTYCSTPTVITYQGQTYPVTTPGTTTIPIVSVSPIAPTTVATPVTPATTPVGTAPVVAPTSGSSSPASTSPVPVVGAAKQNAVGVGALAVAGLAMLI